MQMARTIRSRLTYANVTATLALLIAVGGASAFAATQLAKNSVGANQIKKNAVVTSKIKNGAITAKKIQTDSLTGTQINAATLGTVATAQKAITIASPEGWHEIGVGSQPPFQNGWSNSPLAQEETVGYYKDQDGVVHLRGLAIGGSGSTVIFQLPPGYRPASGKEMGFAVPCSCDDPRGESFTGPLSIFGSGPAKFGGGEGAVIAPGNDVHLDGVTFRAES
jgi:hypothetical protein